MFETGDSVKVSNSETWLVAYCENGKVVCCGWPCSMVDESECELTKKGTFAEKVDLIMTMAAMPGVDSRGSYARRQIARPDWLISKIKEMQGQITMLVELCATVPGMDDSVQEILNAKSQTQTT
jgi:hypothetical protein